MQIKHVKVLYIRLLNNLSQVLGGKNTVKTQKYFSLTMTSSQPYIFLGNNPMQRLKMILCVRQDQDLLNVRSFEMGMDTEHYVWKIQLQKYRTCDNLD